MKNIAASFILMFSAGLAAQTLYPGAPAEANDYDFLMGKWRCVYQQFDKKSKLVFEAPCTWHAEYAFENKMVVDDFTMLDDAGNAVYEGRTLRTYSLQNKRWEQVFLAAKMGATLNPFTAQKVQDEMHLDVQVREPNGMTRSAEFTFTNITEGSFTWENRTTMDKGKSWFVESRIVAER